MQPLYKKHTSTYLVIRDHSGRNFHLSTLSAISEFYIYLFGNYYANHGS